MRSQFVGSYTQTGRNSGRYNSVQGSSGPCLEICVVSVMEVLISTLSSNLKLSSFNPPSMASYRVSKSHFIKDDIDKSKLSFLYRIISGSITLNVKMFNMPTLIVVLKLHFLDFNDRGNI